LADYRLVAERQPDDDSVWWQLGWTSLLRGDLEASIEASGRSIDLQPDEFAVYLNRAIARLLAGDGPGATADVDRSIELLGGRQGASSAAYLAGTDYELGRFAQLHPAQADGLLAIRERLREAQVGLRTAGSPVASPEAPALPAAVVRTVEIGRYAYGRISEGPPLDDGATIDATAGVGLRVELPVAPELAASTLSARAWIDGHLRPELAQDLTLDGTAVEIDLVSPYGYAGFDLDPGAWEVELYVDGATRHRLGFTVAPRVDRPQFDVSASDLVDALTADGFGCEPAADEPAGTACSGFFGEEGSYLGVTVTADEQDRIGYLYLETTVYDDTVVEPVARPFFAYVASLVFPDDLAARATEWIDDQGTAVNEIELGGTTLRVFGAEEKRRFLDVWATWPAT
jgi:hypothetical protein